MTKPGDRAVNPDLLGDGAFLALLRKEEQAAAACHCGAEQNGVPKGVTPRFSEVVEALAPSLKVLRRLGRVMSSFTETTRAQPSLPSIAQKERGRANADSKEAPAMATHTVPMDTFKWIVSGLLGALVVAVGWFLNGIQTDLREVRKEVTGIRVDAAVVSTKLEDLIAEFRRRNAR